MCVCVLVLVVVMVVAVVGGGGWGEATDNERGVYYGPTSSTPALVIDSLLLLLKLVFIYQKE